MLTKVLRRRILAIVGGTLLTASALGCVAVWRHRSGVRLAEEQWQANRYGELPDIGSTRTLSILPLVNWHTANPQLKTEAGVSYLVRTDHHVILFDLGFHRDRSAPSPLRHNMASLGVSPDDVDAIFLSHHHPDHAGGFAAVRNGTVSLGDGQPDLGGRPLFSPVPLVYPGADLQLVREPRRLLDGVASIGPIARQLVLGWVEEQALAVHLEGKGVVLVVGCGHQTLGKILERTDLLFAEGIYAVVGDLHYPTPNGRLRIAGLDVQRRLASGEGLLSPISMHDVDVDLERLRALRPALVALGGHDTHDEVVDRFERSFGASYRHVLVGEAIVLGE